MQCPKCQHENSARVQFCTHCHNPLHFICPACRHTQDHSGKCERCGVDFAKYAAMLVSQAADVAEAKRKRQRNNASLARQILLIPFTGGLSLLRSLLGRWRGE